jgi:hypothetical protein
VDVNYHEARAFCRWKGPDYRLPAEAEHHLMRGTQVGLHIMMNTILMLFITAMMLNSFRTNSEPRSL